MQPGSAAFYQDPKNFFGQLAVVPQDYLALYPEVLVSDDVKKRLVFNSGWRHCWQNPRR